jgi:hypothetical protein
MQGGRLSRQNSSVKRAHRIILHQQQMMSRRCNKCVKTIWQHCLVRHFDFLKARRVSQYYRAGV